MRNEFSLWSALSIFAHWSMMTTTTDKQKAQPFKSKPHDEEFNTIEIAL